MSLCMDAHTCMYMYIILYMYHTCTCTCTFVHCIYCIYTGVQCTLYICVYAHHSSPQFYIHVHVFTAAEVLAAPMTPDGPQEIGFRETKMSDPGKARQAERLGMGVGRVG